MNLSQFVSINTLWILLAIGNFTFQLAYYFNDQSRCLFIAKKTTTPMLLFFGLLIVVLRIKAFPLVPCAILLAMGLGELGIEGSSVVEAQSENSGRKEESGIIVVLSGLLFLLVNVFIGLWLLLSRSASVKLIIAGGAAILFIAAMLYISFRLSKPAPELRTRMILYSIGLAVLLSGVIYDAIGGLSRLGLAAAILTISDSLVLIRMGAGFDKSSKRGKTILLLFLIVILILYYIYMWMLIDIGSGAA